MNQPDAILDALEMMPDGAIVVSSDGVVEAVNDEACRLFARDREAFVGLALEALLPEGKRAQHVGHRQRFFTAPRARAMGQVDGMFARRADGTEFPVDVRIGPFPSASGPAAIAVVRDISARVHESAERRRLAAEVERAKRQLEATMNALPAAVLLLDGDGTILRANHSSELAHAPDCAGRHIDEVFQLASWGVDGSLRAWSGVRDQLTAQRELIEWESCDQLTGRCFRVLARAVPALDGDAAPSFVLVVRDITQTRRIQAFIQTILDSLGQSLAVVDGAGNILHVNAAWRAFAAQNAGDPELSGVGSNYLAVCDRAVRSGDESAAAILDGLKGVLTGRVPSYLQEYPCHAPSGRQRWFILQATPLRDGDGAVLAHVDVTERKVMSDRLAQSQRQDSIGKLASGIAHDLNNILVAVFAGTDLMRLELPSDSPCSEYVEDISAAARRAADLTKRLLTFSRLQISSERAVDLGALLVGQCQVLRRLLPEDMELRLSLDEEQHPVYGDASQLEQILLNLVVNARDAIPQGGSIDVELRGVPIAEVPACAPGLSAPVADSWVRLTVTDRGAGMSDEVRQRVFEPFFTTKPEGTGIGLATVHGIVQQLGGHIGVWSEPGRGTRFTVYLPQTRSPIEARPTPPVARHERRADRCILLVDDDAQLRGAVSLLLERRGYRVTSAASGDEALALARGAHFDLMLSDVVMPNMGGRVLRERMHELRPELPVLFMSGHNEDERLRRGINEAQVNFIQKPFTGDEICGRIRELLGAPRGIEGGAAGAR